MKYVFNKMRIQMYAFYITSYSIIMLQLLYITAVALLNTLHQFNPDY